MAKYWDSKIDKNTDWAGDKSTDNKAVKGNRVQEFIRETLDSKVGEFYYDMTNNRYLVFADKENRDKYIEDPINNIELLIGTFDAPFNYSAKIMLLTPNNVSILKSQKNNYIDFDFDVVDKSGASVGESVVCTYTFIKGNKKKTVNEKYQYQQRVHFNIDKYLEDGINTITIGIVGQTTLAATTIAIVYNVINLELTDTYNVAKVHNINEGVTAVAIPYTVSGAGVKVMEWYLDGVLLPFIKNEDEILDISISKIKYISLENLQHGTHSIQYRTYTIIDETRFYSNILYRDVIVNLGNPGILIAVGVTIPYDKSIVTDRALKLYGVEQYIPYPITFGVFNSNTVVSTIAKILIEGDVESEISTTNEEEIVYYLRSADYGNKLITIEAENVSYLITADIQKSSTSIEEIKDALVLDLNAIGRSNSEVNRDKWTFETYSTKFTGFEWNSNSGWNNNRLILTNASYIDIDFAPFLLDVSSTGVTFEIELSTKNVIDDSAVICDCKAANGSGFMLTASSVELTSSGGAKVSTKYKSEENIRLSLIINKRSGVSLQRMMQIYVNGILSGTQPYSTSDSFINTKELKIGGSNLADVVLKQIKCYRTALTSEQVLNNYILYRDTTDEMLSIYDRNNIYIPGTQTIAVDGLVGQLPVMIVTGEVFKLENTTDKNETIYVDIEYINLQDPKRSFTSKGTRMRPQGTSSMGYPKKNFRIYLNYGTTYDSDGKIIEKGLYQFKDKAQPVSTFCFKADYAESSSSHNTGIARLWNTAMSNTQVDGNYVCKTNAQKLAEANKYPYDVRTTVDGFPVVMFYRLTPEDPLIFLGKYNFNNDKSTEGVFGFTKFIPEFDNKNVQCWEVLNNGNDLALFKSIEGFDSSWQDAFEGRYPDANKNVTNLKTLCTWLVSTKDNIAKFKSEKWDHLDVYKVAAYYIYLMRFGAVDQTVKNAMLTTEDGIHWYFINYDNDTINGLRNDGLLTYNYDIDRQTLDTSFSETVYAYAGHDSTLWNNLEADDEFMNIVSTVDNSLYIAGLSYQNVINMFDRDQSNKYCERVFNQDAQYKYIGPYTDKGINNLFMLQGSRQSHRKWWLSKRFDLIDSMFVSGAYKSKSIEFKVANAPAGINFSIKAGSKLYYGYGVNNVVATSRVKLEAGQSTTFTTVSNLNIGDPVRIYSAINIQELDLSSFIGYISTLNISEVYNEVVGTRFKKLILGVNTSTDNRRNGSLNQISGLASAKNLEYIDVSGYTAITSLDLSINKYLKTLKAFESGITNVTLSNGTPLEVMQLPDATQTINFDNLYNLGSGFEIKNFGRNIRSIYIRNCNKLDSKTFVFNWNRNKLTPNNECSLILNGIKWTDVNPEDIMALGVIKDANGVLSLKGTIRLSSITLDQLNRIKEIYGNNSTIPGNELYISAPDGIYITGPDKFLSGASAQYNASVFSDYIGKIEYFLEDSAGNESLTLSNCTINKTTGLVTSTEVNNNITIKVGAKHLPTQGSPIKITKSVISEKRVYPDSNNSKITGEVITSEIKNYTYVFVPSAGGQTITGEYRVRWSLEGVAYNEGYVEIGYASDTECIVNVLNISAEIKEFIVRIQCRKKVDTSLIVDVSFHVSITNPGIIMTLGTNRAAMIVCYNAGWAANLNYMTEQEAMNVTDIGTKFFDFTAVRLDSFDEFQYFKSVTTIPSNAFKNKTYLESIIFPESITSIQANAFYGCEGLKDIIIPDSVTIIGEHVFELCTSLENIVLSENVLYLSNYLFNGCTKLKNIKFSNKLISIQSLTFRACSNLQTIELPESLKILGANAFEFSGLIDITVPDKIESFGSRVFSNCYKLKNAILPNQVLQSSLFEGCSNLESVTIKYGTGKLSINSSCFNLCTKLKSLIINQIQAPNAIGQPFGSADYNYTGRESYNTGENILYVPVGATGYSGAGWDTLLDSTKCGFTISYTL